MTLALVFGLLFATSLAVALLCLLPSAEVKVLQQRLDNLLPAPRQTGSGEVRPLLRQASKHRFAFATFILRRGPLRNLETLVYQGSGSRDLRPTVMLSLALAATACVVVQVFVRMTPMAALAGMLFGALPLLRLRYLRDRRLQAFNKALPDTIDICARALRAGHSLVAAIGIASEQAPEPAKGEFADIFRKQNFGLPLREALLETLERLPSADFRVFVTGILVQKDTGGHLTEIFDRIVLVMRERLRIAGEIRVHTAQGRMTAWILTLLPPVLFAVVNLLNPGYSRPMFTDHTGRILFYCGIGSLACGGLLVRRIVNGIEV